MTPAPDNLIAWLRGVSLIGASRVEVRHMTAGHESGSVVCTFEPKDEGAGPGFDPLKVYARIEQDAENLGGLQRYVCLAFKEGAKTPRDRLPLRVDGGAGESGDVLSSEPANASGLVAQAHRHNEAFLQLLVRSFGTLLDAQSKQNATLARALEAANEEKVEMWKMLGDIHKHDRDRAEFDAKLRNEEKRAEVMSDSLKLIVPGLVAKLLPSQAVQKTAFVRLVESFKDEQIAAIFPLLTPDQQVALGALLEETLKERARAETHGANGATS